MCARRGDFCVIKSGKDQQEEANKLFIALPKMFFYDSSVLCFDLSFANSIHSQNNKRTCELCSWAPAIKCESFVRRQNFAFLQQLINEATEARMKLKIKSD